MGRGKLISTEVQVETPENIDLEAEPAGLVVRGLAFGIDFLIRIVILFLLSIALTTAGDAGVGLVLIAWFLLEWFYPVLFEVYRRGQTPGKKKFGLRVVNADLTPVGWGSSMTRNLLRWADFFPVLYTAGIISLASTSRCQRLGDIAAGTLVVYAGSDDGQGALPSARPQPPPLPLERDDQVAIIGFAQRHQHLSADRQRELADILAPLLPVDNPQRVDYLHGVGKWLLGERQAK